MKSLILLVAIILVTGCTLGTSRDIKRAEKILSQFQCNKIESTQMSHSPMISYHQRTLAISHQKALSYVKSYKEGEKLFDLPLSEVIEQQYSIYQAACQNLGGIPAVSNQ